MTKRLAQEAAYEGKWSSAAGIGLLGLVGSLGITPILIILLVTLGAGVFLVLTFLPLIVTIILSGLVFWTTGYTDLSDIHRIMATLITGAGSLILLQFVDITLWSLNLAGGGGATSQGIIEGIIGFIRTPFSLIAGFLLVLVVLATMWSFSKVKTVGPPLAGFIGLIVSIFIGSKLLNWDFSLGHKITGASASGSLPFDSTGVMVLSGGLVIFIVITVLLTWRDFN